MELRQRLMLCLVFSSLETNVYKVIISFEDSASASANHNIFSTVYTKELVKLQVESGKQMPLSYRKV